MGRIIQTSRFRVQEDGSDMATFKCLDCRGEFWEGYEITDWRFCPHCGKPAKVELRPCKRKHDYYDNAGIWVKREGKIVKEVLPLFTFIHEFYWDNQWQPYSFQYDANDHHRWKVMVGRSCRERESTLQRLRLNPSKPLPLP